MSPAEVVARQIAALGYGTLGGTASWAIFIAAEPDKPGNTITAYDTGGRGHDTDELDIENPTVQVRVRALGYSAAFDKATAIKQGLAKGAAFEFGNWRVEWANVITDVASLGKNEKGLDLVTVNFELSVSPA